MAKNFLGKFQTQAFDSWKGLTKDVILNTWFGNAFHGQANEASKMIVELLAYQQGPYMESILNDVPTKKFDTDDEYTWNVMASARQNIPLLEARDITGTPVTSGMVGKGTEPFYLVFGKDWFADGEYILGNLNEVYQFRVLGDARMEGTNAVYKVELAGGNIDGVPADRLQAGELFSIEAAFVEGEMSREVGDVRFAMPVGMRNEFSHIRIKHKVPGNKLNKKLAIGIPIIVNNKKMTTNLWMHDVDYAVETQFKEYKNNAVCYGRSNRNANGEYTNIGKSGNAIRTGDGLYAQMEAANVIWYNDFSIKIIEDALYNLTRGTSNFKNRKVTLITGEKGAILFHKAITDIASGWTAMVPNPGNPGFIQKTTSTLHENAFRAGFQFTEYLGPNGVHLKLTIDHSLDDDIRNKIQHPLGGPASSYIFRIMDIGGEDGQANIFKCVVNNEPEYRGYQWGPFRNPFTGETGNPYASFDEDAAVIHKYATFGVCVLDPTRTITIKPAILAA